MRLAIVILNYKTPQLVMDCLASLQGEVDPMQDCVVIVDNASGDGSAERIQQNITQKSHIKLVKSPQNNGFSAGNNLGMQAVDAEAYLLLNSDTLVRPGAIFALLACMEANPASGLISPRLEWPDGEPQISCFNYPSPMSQLIDAAATGPITRLFARYDVPIAVSNEQIKPPWTSFAAVLIRGKTLHDVGWMDERFFMYFEDVDYGRRVWDAGWDVLHCPEARIVHLRGGSSNVKKATAERKRRPRYFYEARAHYLTKHYGKIGFYAANLLWGIGRLIALFRETIGSKQPHTCEREWQDNWIQGKM